MFDACSCEVMTGCSMRLIDGRKWVRGGKERGEREEKINGRGEEGEEGREEKIEGRGKEEDKEREEKIEGRGEERGKKVEVNFRRNRARGRRRGRKGKKDYLPAYLLTSRHFLGKNRENAA